MAYRISRNIEASFIDYITAEINASWTGVSVEKSYTRIYELDVPGIWVRLGTTEHERVQVGNDSTVRTPQILIDIFGQDDGNRLDLKDFLIEKLKSGIPYYEYTIVDGVVDTKVENGRIRVDSISDIPLNFGTDKERLDIHDRYRHLLTLEVSLGKVEV
jgi:hypothetical protein